MTVAVSGVSAPLGLFVGGVEAEFLEERQARSLRLLLDFLAKCLKVREIPTWLVTNEHEEEERAIRKRIRIKGRMGVVNEVSGGGNQERW